MSLQQQIQSLAEQLEQIAAQVAEPVKHNDTDFEKILIEAANHPFQHHPIMQQDEYIKALYVQVLLSIVHQSDSYKTERYSIAARIYHGLELTDSFESYIYKSQMLSLQDFVQFYNLVKENDFSELFLLDSLLILGVQSEKRISEYVTELISNLDVSQRNFTRACQLIKAILRVDEKEIKKLFTESKLYYKSAVHLLTAIQSNCSPIICIEGDGKTVVNIEDYVTEKLILKNVLVKIPENYVISDLESLKLVNCKVESEALDFTIHKIDSIYLKNINFNECSEIRCIKIQQCSNVTLDSISIEDKEIHSNCLFNIEKVKNLYAKNFKLKDIKILPGNMFDFLSIVINSKLKLGFIRVTDIENIIEENNQLINCEVQNFSHSATLNNFISKG